MTPRCASSPARIRGAWGRGGAISAGRRATPGAPPTGKSITGCPSRTCRASRRWTTSPTRPRPRRWARSSASAWRAATWPPTWPSPAWSRWPTSTRATTSTSAGWASTWRRGWSAADRNNGILPDNVGLSGRDRGIHRRQMLRRLLRLDLAARLAHAGERRHRGGGERRAALPRFLLPGPGPLADGAARCSGGSSATGRSTCPTSTATRGGTATSTGAACCARRAPARRRRARSSGATGGSSSSRWRRAAPRTCG